MENLQKCLILLFLWGPLKAKELIPIGVILDLNSQIGSMANSCISMALHDFYQKNSDYKTRLDLRTRDSNNDIIKAASAAFDLIKNEKVHAIIGPQRSGEARFIIELGRKAKVPIISFSATSPSLSPTLNHFFIRTAQDDCSQVKAIASVIEAYGWREVIPIYEDTEYGNGLMPYLNEALEEIDTRVPHRVVIDPHSNETEIFYELKRLKNKLGKQLRTKIFVVHMTSDQGSKLFSAADKAQMISEGYAWIVTEGLSAVLEPVENPIVLDSMQGVLGVRPMVPQGFEKFEKRWKAFTGQESTKSPLTLFGLWAYDTFWALAMAVEKAGITNSAFQNQNATNNISWYDSGSRLLNQILSTEFPGISGYFNLSEGQLVPSKLEIFNLVGHRERIIGYWNKERGLSRDLVADEKSFSERKLKQPIWPGDTTEKPTKLRIGVPVKRGFKEFMKVERQSSNNDIVKISGFAIDVFLEVVKVLPFRLPYEFVPFMNKSTGEAAGSYDELKFDVVVGDVTIVANRTKYVDFALPYSESGISMVVLTKRNDRQNMWIFLKPLSWDLWLTTGAAFVLTNFIVWLLEHPTNTDFHGSREQQLGTIMWFSFSTLVFAQKEKIVNNWSRLVLIIWIFVVLIITQSYTASLASMLTVQRLQPAFMDIEEIKRNNYYVGYQRDSFVEDMLKETLGFNDSSKLRAYESPEEFDQALSTGSDNGGVAAIFDEIPYLNVFLTKYGSRYKMVGPTYKTDGFSFAFPRNSPLVSYFSRAILNVTEDKDIFSGIKNKYFSSGISSGDQSASITSDITSLTVYSFAGLLLITAVAFLLSLVCYLFSFLYSEWHALRTIPSEQRSFWSMLNQIAKHYDQKDSSLHPPTRSNSRVYPAASPQP
ncbi:hypothetical protein L6164_000949 [Bauhinia variegata]|uniref:Uncharacterized protein n=1 Tax=Bauhinia variegata TaxID=167791 RepID=A0ACB9QA92_BAUVA|nr:hypothetical protein L6164_000949 [Bauhinia variegata]